MISLALLWVLAGGDGSRALAVEVQVKCSEPVPAVPIVWKGDDAPFMLTAKRGVWFVEDDLPVVVFPETWALLHLRGRRTDCQQPVMTSDQVAQYTFNNCGKESLDLVIAPEPRDLATPYDRSVKGEPPDCNSGSRLNGETTIEDVIPTEDVVLRFGQEKGNGPSLKVHFHWPEGLAVPSRKPAARKVNVVDELVLQQGKNGYAAPNQIDVNGTVVGHFTRLTIRLVDPRGEKNK